VDGGGGKLIIFQSMTGATRNAEKNKNRSNQNKLFENKRHALYRLGRQFKRECTGVGHEDWYHLGDVRSLNRWRV